MSVSLLMHNAGRPATTYRHVVAGITLIELAVTLSLMFIIVGTAIPMLDPGRLHVNAAQRLVIANIRLARAAAITKGVHYQVSFPLNDNTRFSVIRMKENPAGSGTWVTDNTQVQTNPLPSKTNLANNLAGTTIEFNTRGFAVNVTAVEQIDLQDKYGATKSLQVWPSGQVNEL
jgi:Tfp pilus assembly protein FimT